MQPERIIGKARASLDIIDVIEQCDGENRKSHDRQDNPKTAAQDVWRNGIYASQHKINN